MKPSLLKRGVAEFTATAFLLMAIVGSGIMAERLAAGNVAVALLANSIATGAALMALILTFGDISGAHMNPVVTLADASIGGIVWRVTPVYIAAQFAGALAGVGTAHLMFGLPPYTPSLHIRSGLPQVFSEFVATFGLSLVIAGCVRHRPQMVPFAVSAYIVAAYWFTASTSFANPAVTLARSMTNTFAGIRHGDVAAFIAAQFAGALVAVLYMRWQAPRLTASETHD
jgi:glycerol uptake facilitator-like aquaporin